MKWEPTADELARATDATRVGPEWRTYCPAHDDDRMGGAPSLDFRERDGKVAFACRTKGCSPRAIAEAFASRFPNLYPVETTIGYEARSPDGKLLATHMRADAPPGRAYPDGRTKRVWWEPKLRDAGIRLTAMPLWPSWLMPPAGPVVVCEGEKAAASIRRVSDFFGLGTMTGSATIPDAAALSVLKGRDVILFPDNDADGAKHMERIGRALVGVAASLRIVQWSEKAPAKYDAADLTPGVLIVALNGAVPYPPPREPGLDDDEGPLFEDMPDDEPEAAPLQLRTIASYSSEAKSKLDKLHAGDYSDRVPTGFPSLDRALRGGWRPGEVVLIGGTTGTGKTVLVQQLAFAAAARGPVLFVSPEMDGDQLYTREVIRRSRVPEINRVVWFLTGENPSIRDVRREDAQAKHEAAMAAIDAENAPVFLLDLPDTIVNIDLVADAARQVKGLSLVVVDYAQEIANDDPKRPRFLSVGDVARGSVRIARSLKVPVIVTSQVNVVGGDKKAERDPKVDDYEFRESKVMEQKASVSLILMTRPNESGRFNDDAAFVQLASRKVRSGPRIELRLRWAQELFSFSETEYTPIATPPPPTTPPETAALLFQ